MENSVNEDGENAGGPSRRAVLARTGAVGTLLLSGGLVTAATAQAASGTARGAADAAASAETVELRDSANLAVSLSPDGTTLAIDALNVVWLMPAEGGPARRLTDDAQEAAQPHWSPDGRGLVFQAYREGTYDLWWIGADGSGLRRLTSGPGCDEEPKFSPDGRYVAFFSDRGHAGRIWLLDITTGALRALTDGDRAVGMPTWSPDGQRVAYTADGSTIEAVDVSSGAVEKLLTAPEGATVHAPAFSPDGRRIAYVRIDGPWARLMLDDEELTDGEDVFPLAPVWVSADELLYTADGRIRRRRAAKGPAQEIGFTVTVSVARAAYRRKGPDITSAHEQSVLGIADPVISPDARKIAFRALNALWLLPIGGEPQKIVSDGYYNSAPDWSPDGRKLVYVSDRSGGPGLWTYDVTSRATTRLTDLPEAQLAPRWSPDGSRIAYQDQSGATWILRLADGSVTKVLTAIYQPGPPSWSPDGRMLALAANAPYSKRNVTGHNQILTVHLETGRVRYEAVAPERSISTRSGDGPVWTRDGSAFVVGLESLAWRVPVDSEGRIAGAPAQLTDEVTDSVSVAATTGTVLYLSNGRLRTVSAQGGTPATVPTRLTWRRRPSPTGRTVIRAGAVWDGEARTARQDADVVIEEGRIVDVVRRGAMRGGRVVDASGLTALPGLIDTHNHWHWRGAQWGDRQGRAWLAYGVTTSRSPGDPAYQMVENREALAAGTRVGPRFLGTGEGMEGTRGNHKVMRLTFSREQLDRDVDRALALKYDLLKCYVRLPVSYERHAVSRMHAAGVPATSHYVYPAVRSGFDGMEHTGGGNRLGYSRTLSHARGRGYADTVALLVASGMWISTTTMFASELFVDDRSLIEDERTRVLFPSWEYQRLLQKAKDADGGPLAELYREWTIGDVDLLLRVQRAGGLVVLGTDAALDDIGISMHQNLRVMVKYGFTPWEALRTATVNAARCLGLEGRLGSLAPGFLADLTLVEGDPLRDIGAAAAVRHVMVGGHAYTVPELLEPFSSTSATSTSPGRADGAVRNEVRPAAPGAEHKEEHYWHGPEWRHRGCCR